MPADRNLAPYVSSESRAIESLALVVTALAARLALLEAETATVRLVWTRDINLTGGHLANETRARVVALQDALLAAETAAAGASLVVDTLAAVAGGYRWRRSELGNHNGPGIPDDF